jgi:hypothetical protein
MAGGDGSGKGIIGMTERAHALAGTLEAGPRPDGGFRVRACLPWNGETPLNASTGDGRPARARRDRADRDPTDRNRAGGQPAGGDSAGGNRGARSVAALHGDTP